MTTGKAVLGSRLGRVFRQTITKRADDRSRRNQMGMVRPVKTFRSSPNRRYRRTYEKPRKDEDGTKKT